MSFISSNKNASKVQKIIRILPFGGNSIQTKGKYLLEIKELEEINISLQSFLSFTGKNIQIYEQNINESFLLSTLRLGKTNEVSNFNSLFIPETGLNCQSNSVDSSFFYVTVSRKGLKLMTNVFSDKNANFTFNLGNFKGNLKMTGEYNWNAKKLYGYSNELDSNEIDDFRLLLRKLVIISEGFKEFYVCSMEYGDPNAEKPKLIEFSEFEKVEEKENGRNLKVKLMKLISVFMSCAIFVAIVFLLLKYKRRKNEM